MTAPPPLGGVVQNVTATAGFAYGVIGADLHVLGDGTPVYVLENYLRPPSVDSGWLRELPSRMLNARFAVVGFTGRDSERGDLQEWSQADARLAARWLHAPGGQGKTRLAARIAEELMETGWKVVTATHGPGTVLPPPGSQDMRLGGARGLLLIIDYADRWPLTHLTWLLSNALLHQTAVPTRLLLLARTADAWPALRERLDSYQAGVSQQFLTSLSAGLGYREQAFIAARDSFAAHYGLAEPSTITPPAGLDRPEWGLMLTVHMAALVAVDAHVHGGTPARDPAGLTAYLLDRERSHWTHLYENRASPGHAPGLEFRTPPSVMSGAVFTAVLIGPVNYLAGKAILDGLDLEIPSDRVLADHTACYPPADLLLATVLEPLYPDRLAEDFLGVTLPGHAADQPSYAWAPSIATMLLNSTADYSAAVYTPRAITFLAAATERWPHIGETFLYPLLRREPQLGLAHGGSVLTALAGIPTIPIDLLEILEALFPDQGHIDLDTGIAAVTQRLTDHRLAHTTDLAERARLLFVLGARLSRAGLNTQSVAAKEQAVEIYRRLARDGSSAYLANLAESLSDLSSVLAPLGRQEDALAAKEQAVEIYRELVRTNPSDHGASLATSLAGLCAVFYSQGLYGQALSAIEESVAIYRRLDAAKYLPGLGTSLINLAVTQLALGRREKALAANREAIEVNRGLARANPALYLPELAMSMHNIGTIYLSLGHWEDALAASAGAVELYRSLAEMNSAVYLPRYGESLNNLGALNLELARQEEALAAVREAVEVYRELARDNPAAHEQGLAAGLINLARALAELGRAQEALPVAEQAVQVNRRLAQQNPAIHESGLAKALSSLILSLVFFGRLEDALPKAEEVAVILRRLARDNPGVHEADLARSLNDLAAVQSRLGRQEDALAVLEQAIELLRSLAQGYPGAYEHLLAMALINLGTTLVQLGRPEDALVAIEQAVELYNHLVEASPAVHEARLALSLTMLGELQLELGHAGNSLAATEQAVEIYNRLARHDSATHEPDLAMSLSNLGAIKSKLGRMEEGANATNQAVEIYRRLAQDNPGFYEPDLAMLLNNLRTLSSTEEAVEIYRKLTRSNAQVYEPILAQALGVYASVRAQSGDELETALAASKEATAIYHRLHAEMPDRFASYLRAAKSVAADILDQLGRTDDAAPVRNDLGG